MFVQIEIGRLNEGSLLPGGRKSPLVVGLALISDKACNLEDASLSSFQVTHEHEQTRVILLLLL